MDFSSYEQTIPWNDSQTQSYSVNCNSGSSHVICGREGKLAEKEGTQEMQVMNQFSQCFSNS